MKNVKVYAGQTLIDIAIQELGDRERVFELVELNNIGLTDDIEAGTYLIVPAAAYDKKELIKPFTLDVNKPASAIRSGLTEGESSGFIIWIPSTEQNKGVKVYYGQTIIDIAIQELGDRERELN